MKKVAFDENYSWWSIFKLTQVRREKCVYKPKQGTPDEVWVLEAFDAGAEVIYSRDLDIPNLIERYDLPMQWRNK